MTKNFAVIDVETNWNNEAMSIGIVVADSADFRSLDQRYFVLQPECNVGGMYSDRLQLVDEQLITLCSRDAAMAQTVGLFSQYGVTDIFAYNAPFDRNCLEELQGYTWRDILPTAANRNTNVRLPGNCEYFSTGLLKYGRSLQNVLRMIFDAEYTETHNGLQDAMDELLLMKILGQPLEIYVECKPKQNTPERKPTPSNNRVNVSLSALKYVVDELCGGSIRLLDDKTTTTQARNDGVKNTTVKHDFSLQCSRCGYVWTQDADAFFRDHVCPACGKKGNA